MTWVPESQSDASGISVADNIVQNLLHNQKQVVAHGCGKGVLSNSNRAMFSEDAPRSGEFIRVVFPVSICPACIRASASGLANTPEATEPTLGREAPGQ